MMNLQIDETWAPVVTVSATYGAGGGFIGPRLAERLGVTFVDRAVTVAVADAMAKEATIIEEFEEDMGLGIAHWLSRLAPIGGFWGAPTATDSPCDQDERMYKRHVAAVLHREAARGAVVLGRGSQVILRDVPRALHVRLDGPLERRIARAVEFGGIDEATARRAQHQTDAARERYFHRLHHGHVADPRFYDLIIDATAVPWATCVDIIVTAVVGCDEIRRLNDSLDHWS